MKRKDSLARKGMKLLCTFLGIVFLAMGIYLVLQSGGNMIEAFKLKKLGYNSLPSLILMGALLVLGLLMTFAHTIVRGWVMLLLGGFLVACGLSNLIFRTLAVRKLRQPKTANVVDADE